MPDSTIHFSTFALVIFKDFAILAKYFEQGSIIRTINSTFPFFQPLDLLDINKSMKNYV
jgi:hypothetical protein